MGNKRISPYGNVIMVQVLTIQPTVHTPVNTLPISFVFVGGKIKLINTNHYLPDNAVIW